MLFRSVGKYFYFFILVVNGLCNQDPTTIDMIKQTLSLSCEENHGQDGEGKILQCRSLLECEFNPPYLVALHSLYFTALCRVDAF